MSGTESELPEGRSLAVTWGLTREFGGMTNAMLRRSRAFVRVGGVPVEVLTFDAREDYLAIEQSLRVDGRLIDGIRLRNLWDEVTEMTDPGPPPRQAKERALEAFSPLEPTGSRTVQRAAADGTLLQLDRRRADGTVAVSDRRDVREPGRLGGRSIVVCDAHGEPLFGFTRPWPFYSWWLDTVIGDDVTHLLVDSKTAANFVLEYRNPRATRIHVVHNSHLAGEVRPWGLLKGSRRAVFSRLDEFDGVTVLSERQREDAIALLDVGEVLEGVPTSTALPPPAPREVRDRLLGVVVASLDNRKRVDHAIRAIAAARQTGAEVHLDIYGEGPNRQSLVALVDELGLTGAVRFRGFRPDAADSFGSASFFLLTSRTEGFPLVLAEGMARGCIPLAYDIPYGPADLIDSGRTGHLLAPGDTAGLAERITELAQARPDELEEMRAAGRTAAARFSDEAVLARWAGVLRRSTARARRPRPAFTITVKSGSVTRTRSGARATADFLLSGIATSPSELDASLALHGAPATGDGAEVRRRATVRRTLRHGVWRATADFPPEAAALFGAGLPDVPELIVRVGGRVRRGAPGAD